jgi:hypothetical protein
VETTEQATAIKGKRGNIANLRPFPKGVSGNPSGRPKKLPLTESYERLLTPTQANRLARKAIEQAAKGSLGHLVEITDRVEGRVAQKHEVSGVVVHELTAVEKQSALKSLSKLTAYDSDAENPIEAEFTEE